MPLVYVSDLEYNPLYTLDTHDPGWTYSREVDEWLQAQGVDTSVAYRFEVYVIDTPCVRVFERIREEDGGIAYSVERAPYMIPISSFPPSMQSWSSDTWPTPYRWSTP